MRFQFPLLSGMAWRIDESVVRGEIENCSRGRVTGRIWLADLAGPVELDLEGNAWRDLAGRRLVFVNPAPQRGLLHPGFAPRQRGVIGDCTASRKVKVPDVSNEDLRELYEQRKPFPWHWSNSLYLEWFTAANGRVIIESAGFQLSVSTESTWEMTAEEEEIQQRANATVMAEFMQKLDEGMKAEGAAKRDASPTPKANWQEESAPLTEAEAEKMQEESDRFADRIQARLDREGPDADYQRIFAEEFERRRIARGEKPLTPEQEAEWASWVTEMNHAADEALTHPDPELKAELEAKHPLAEAASELADRLYRESEDQAWLPDDARPEHPVSDLIDSANCAAAKLAGALNGLDWPPIIECCASVIVRLKRARGYIDDGLLAAEVCEEQRLINSETLSHLRRDLNSIGHECDLLIGELRAVLARGFS